ncbi:hypothetical protein ACWXWI_23015, partial [Pantoea ananatis]
PCTQEVSGSIPLSSTILATVFFSENTSERTGNGVLRSILLFNNPEQAENLKRHRVAFFRNKE